jgi:hypothetical protein
MLNSQNIALEHYSRLDVQKEIVDYCSGRWVGLHCLGGSGKLVFRRYFGGKPIAVSGADDLTGLIDKLKTVRSIYGSANKYHIVERVEDVFNFSNVRSCTPTWDVDGQILSWRKTLAVARELVCFLESEGVQKSLYIKWSGNGCHVYINEEAFSQDVLNRAHPLDLAYAIVEYVRMKVSPKILGDVNAEGVVVENRMDPGRVFTCPLSLHRNLDVVCVCLKPNQLDSFSLEWVHPSAFKHNGGWRDFRKGEADQIALKAYNEVGGYPLQRFGRRRRSKSLDQQIQEWLQKS